MSDIIISTLIAAAISIGIALGILVAFPRTRRALVPATVTILAVLTALAVLGSAMVGPVSLSPLLFHVPIAGVVITIWYFWKIRPKAMSDG